MREGLCQRRLRSSSSLDRPMYVHLHKFGGVFPKLAELRAAPCADPAATGAEEQLEVYSYLLEQMAQSSPSEIFKLNVFAVDAVHRNCFMKTQFYANYCQHLVWLLCTGCPPRLSGSHRRPATPAFEPGS